MALKSHFRFSNSERNGIFLLAALIIIFQCIYAFADFSSDEPHIDNVNVDVFRRRIDSLKRVAIESRKTDYFPYNPNYITDYKGYTLGMSPDEIDRLLAFRKRDQWVNSAKEFQEVTMVSDSLLQEMAPLFKFPDWVTNPKPRPDSGAYLKKTATSFNKNYDQKVDLNVATLEQLQRVNGIGEKLSERIISYREKFPGGFISDIQLQDIYGLTPEVIERITDEFTVKTPRMVDKINLNSATRDQLVTVPYIDYEIAHYIIEQRTLRESFETFEELLKVKNFPIKKLEIIKLYLTLN